MCKTMGHEWHVSWVVYVLVLKFVPFVCPLLLFLCAWKLFPSPGSPTYPVPRYPTDFHKLRFCIYGSVCVCVCDHSFDEWYSWKLKTICSVHRLCCIYNIFGQLLPHQIYWEWHFVKIRSLSIVWHNIHSVTELFGYNSYYNVLMHCFQRIEFKYSS